MTQDDKPLMLWWIAEQYKRAKREAANERN
jgi:hypothetical protein